MIRDISNSKLAQGLKKVLDDMPNPTNKIKEEGFRLQVGGTCLKCNENLCKCPERQADGSWKKLNSLNKIKEEILGEFDVNSTHSSLTVIEKAFIRDWLSKKLDQCATAVLKKYKEDMINSGYEITKRKI